MKLVHPYLKMSIKLNNDYISEFIIENQKAMYNFINDLYNQCNGNKGYFVLSDENNILDIAKVGEFLFNPFQIDLNNRKIIKKLYSIIKNEVLSTELIDEFSNISSSLLNFAEKLSETSMYNISFSINEDVEEFLKYIKVKIQDDESISLCEKIIDFINISSSLLNIKLLILINFRSYLDEEELYHIHKEAMYKDVALLLIENSAKEVLSNSRRFIVDKDLCEIYDD